jgi:hypothetical protein
MNAYRTYANGEAVEHHVFDDPRWDVVVIRVDPAVEIWESDV